MLDMALAIGKHMLFANCHPQQSEEAEVLLLSIHIIMYNFFLIRSLVQKSKNVGTAVH